MVKTPDYFDELIICPVPVILLQLYFYSKALWADIQLIAVHCGNRVVEVVKYFCAGLFAEGASVS